MRKHSKIKNLFLKLKFLYHSKMAGYYYRKKEEYGKNTGYRRDANYMKLFNKYMDHTNVLFSLKFDI